ncbi:MAG TPA: hypothetical protein DCS66_06200 [Flavobacteriaceae bacterium]|nr:hypothetical protein [Flavobacteriaceae bacterium]HAT64180.1 hypothetical protein [Flavobacteriaceae bacterium]|tara:strand:+ start:230870 stop:231613 length:744 start_codon:yes stop_codon:yes gene_type:complete
MAKQKGIIPLVGTLGGLNFYYLNGKPVVRVAGGGFNGKAIKTKASMQRVRENSSEFGHCSRVNKAFRMALKPFYAGHRFTFLHSRLMGLFTQLKDLDTVHERGRRVVAEGVATAEGHSLLKGFGYTPDCALQKVLPFGMVYDGTTHTFTVTDFAIKRVGFVAGATHVKLTFGVLGFDFDTLDYGLYLDTPLVLDRQAVDTALQFEVVVPPDAPGLLLGVFGVRFYQEVDGTLYGLKGAESVGFEVFL